MSDVLVGDVIEVLPTLPSGHYHCVVTSPPYWNLRDYGCDGQLGLEPTPEAYVENMTSVFREVRRVLHPSGTLWLNMGDSYASDTKGSGGGWANDPKNYASKAQNYGKRKSNHGLKPKDLCGMPWRLAFALQADGWYLRSAIVWAKGTSVLRREGAVMPESVTDRPTSAYEMVFLLTKNARYFYDAEASKESVTGTANDRGHGVNPKAKANDRGSRQNASFAAATSGPVMSTGNLRNVWRINTAPYPEAHFATYPPKIVEQCLKAGTSEKGCCPECGMPWVRVVERSGGTIGKSWHGHGDDIGLGAGQDGPDRVKAMTDGTYAVRTTGWRPGCGHTWGPIPCRVLDPFGGSGTTGMVAAQMGLDYTLIELNPEYAQLARDRTGAAMKPGTYTKRDTPAESPLFPAETT